MPEDINNGITVPCKCDMPPVSRLVDYILTVEGNKIFFKDLVASAKTGWYLLLSNVYVKSFL